MDIAIAVSGGIDSLYTALFFKEQGKNVIGIFGIFTSFLFEIKQKIIADFERLGIECIALDLRKEFEELVVLPFVNNYLRGLTPNPCCICNKTIKFNLIQKKVRDLGIENFGTGHYVNVVNKGEKKQLVKGIDTQKDQSYFLCLVKVEDLQGVHMPLGSFTKQEVRDALLKKGIVPPIKGESQEICFVKRDYRDFLKKRGINLPGPGPIIGVWGDRLGTHNGLFNYTIGQRRGLGISYREPLYVVHKDLEENILIVGTKKDLQSKSCIVYGMNYLEEISLWPKEIEVKCNYNMIEKRARIELIDLDRVKVIFDEPVNRPTPGQICCFYSGSTVLGGGIICEE